MMLSQYIEQLQTFLDANGDMIVAYAEDAEGNDYHEVEYSPSLFFCMDTQAYGLELYSEDDVEDYPDDEFTRVCVVN